MSGNQQIEREIMEISAPILARLGLELVELAVRGSGSQRVVRLDIDRAGAHGVGIDDCQQVSREISDKLDELDPIDGAYQLEVSSPGIDRPLRTADDFRRNTGRRVRITAAGDDGTFLDHRGFLQQFDGNLIELRTEDDSAVRIALNQVKHAQQDVGQ
jgi:ribosome maturation factor RimP